MSLASTHHGGRFWLVVLAVTAALVLSASDPCDFLTIISNCGAEHELCYTPCISNSGFASETCLEECGVALEFCTDQVVECSGCFDDDEVTGQAAGDLCVPADAPLFTQPCLTSSIAYRCSDEVQDCYEESDFTTTDIDRCTDMLLECSERERAKCPDYPVFHDDGRFNSGSPSGSIWPFCSTCAFALTVVATSVLGFVF